MRKPLTFLGLALALAGCAQQQPSTPTIPAPTTDCSHVISLPHAWILVGQRESFSTLKVGVSGVHLTWQGGGLTGGDSVYTWSQPDRMALGCLDGLEVRETSFEAAGQ